MARGSSIPGSSTLATLSFVVTVLHPRQKKVTRSFSPDPRTSPPSVPTRAPTLPTHFSERAPHDHDGVQLAGRCLEATLEMQPRGGNGHSKTAH